MRPPSANYHVNQACNYSCNHCFATFHDVRAETGLGMLPRDQQIAIVEALTAAGFEKLTIAGGEPTLVPWLVQLCEAFPRTTMLVTNGSRLDDAMLDRLAPHLDWVVLSIDARLQEVSRAIGRCGSDGVAMGEDDHLRLARQIRARGLRLKVNTVVSRTNLDEDMAPMIAAMAPERWKILQVLPVEGQNDEHIDRLTISREAFDGFIERHRRALADEPGIVLVPEPCDAIRGSYAMVDPAGRFFDSTLGCHTYSRPILEAGVEEAFSEVRFDANTFERRGGIYNWHSSNDQGGC